MGHNFKLHIQQQQWFTKANFASDNGLYNPREFSFDDIIVYFIWTLSFGHGSERI